MAVELWVDDGNPWYLSPDIWVVPGTDPNAAPGIPVADQASYVWAYVHNRGKYAVNNATVHYYWADPSTIITRNTATLIGTSYVSLAAGQSAKVLCLTPWIPRLVNGGHECLLAEAFSAEDPLLPHTPDDPFDPPSDRHVAQRNLTIVTSLHGLIIFPFAVGNARRLRTEEVRVEVRRAPIELVKGVQESLRLVRLPLELANVGEFGLQRYQCGDQVQEVGTPGGMFVVRPGTQQGLALVVRLPKHQPNHGALFLIEQFLHQQVIGGIGVLVLSQTHKVDDPKPEGKVHNA
jgi:hypothetical protein